MSKLKIFYGLFSVMVLLALTLVVDYRRVAQSILGVSAVPALFAFGLVQIQVILSAVRWRFTAARLGHVISLSTAVKEYYLSTTFNQILPGGMAGDVLRAIRSRTDKEGDWKRPASAVFLERLSGQVAFAALTALGFVAWPFVLAERLPIDVTTMLLVCLGAIVVLLVLVRALRPTSIGRRIAAVYPSLKNAFWHDGAFMVQLLLSVAILAGYVLTFLIASSAVGAPLPAGAAFTIIPLCLLAMLLPIGIGGWGTREAAAAALWPLFGFEAVQGVSASIAYGVFSLVGAALPTICLLVWRGGRRILRH